MNTGGPRDLLAPLLGLPGVADAAEAARVALGKAHRHRANLRNWPVTAAESAVRGARSSSVLDGGGVDLGADSGPDDPVLAGALRVGQALEGGSTSIVGVWQRAPLQALARLHALAAADLVDDERLGRPRQLPEVVARLDLLTRLVGGGSSVPAPLPHRIILADGRSRTDPATFTAPEIADAGKNLFESMHDGLDDREPFDPLRAGDSGMAQRLQQWLLACSSASQGPHSGTGRKLRSPQSTQ